jgi:hypothetical protein
MSSVDNSDDYVEIELRSAATVARRCIILSSVVQRIGIDSSALSLVHGDPYGAAYDLREWLRTEGLWGDLTPREAAFLSRPPEELVPNAVKNATIQLESLAAVGWALSMASILSDGFASEITEVLSEVPDPWDKTAPWINSKSLRPESEIARIRERAELWEWRLAMEPYRRVLEGRELMDLERTIKDTMRDGAMAGMLAPGKKGGFTIKGVPVTRLDPYALEELHMLAEERLLALNWICGYGDDWDSVPLEF